MIAVETLCGIKAADHKGGVEQQHNIIVYSIFKGLQFICKVTNKECAWRKSISKSHITITRCSF